MEHRPARTHRFASSTLAVLAGGGSLAFAELAMAADEWSSYWTALTTDEWSGYLLFGSIALLICGALIKMFTYRGQPESRAGLPEEHPLAGAEERYTIGANRNRALIPGP